MFTHPTTFLPRSTATEARLPRSPLLEAWPAVHLTDVEIRAPRTTDTSLATVRACVYLGPLTPADVHVELVDAPDGTVAHDGERAIVDRLSSVQSYDNGTFVFETRVPVARLERMEDLSIRVSAAPDAGGASAARPIARRILVVDDAGPVWAPDAERIFSRR